MGRLRKKSGEDCIQTPVIGNDFHGNEQDDLFQLPHQ
jgi:hypothetical protein